MKKKLSLIIVGVIALQFSGCGRIESYSGAIGTCSYTMNGSKFCTDYSFSGQFKNDPTNDAVDAIQSACRSRAPLGAEAISFDRSATCSRTGATDLCIIRSNATSANGETVTMIGELVFPASVNTSTAKFRCTLSQGTHRSI